MKSSAHVYGLDRRPGAGSPRTPAQGAAAHAGSSAARRGRGLRARLRRRQPARDVALLRFSNVVGPDIVTPITGPAAAARAVDLRLRPPLPVRPRRRRDPLDPVRPRPRRRRHLQRGRRRPAAVERGRGDLRQAHHPTCRRSPPASPPIRCGASASTCRPSCSTLLRYGRGVDNRRLKRDGFRYEYTSAGAVAGLRRGVTSARHRRATTSPTYRYERDVELFFRPLAVGAAATNPPPSPSRSGADPAGCCTGPMSDAAGGPRSRATPGGLAGTASRTTPASGVTGGIWRVERAVVPWCASSSRRPRSRARAPRGGPARGGPCPTTRGTGTTGAARARLPRPPRRRLG